MKFVDEEIRRIKAEVLKLHEVAKEATKLLFISMRGDKTVVREILKLEELSDELEVKIHDDCAHFIMRFHPVAKDLRFALGIFRISSAYERIVDLVLEISLYDCKFRERIFGAEEPLMAMFETLEKAFGELNISAESMISLDDIIDGIYIEGLEEVERDFRCVDEVLAIRHIERIGDLLCKIATRLVYINEGRWLWIK
jgi:phosphate transport system protein